MLILSEAVIVLVSEQCPKESGTKSQPSRRRHLKKQLSRFNTHETSSEGILSFILYK